MNIIELKRMNKDFEDVVKKVNALKSFTKNVPEKLQKNFIQSISAVNDGLEILEDTLTDIKISLD